MNIMPKTISSKLRGGVELSSTSGDVDDDAPDDDAPDDVDDDAGGVEGKSQ
jgi:hypothetical protein